MKQHKKLLSLILVTALVLSMFSVVTSTQAKKKVTVSSVKITNVKKKLTLKKGSTFKLKTKVTVSPNKKANKKVTFKSSKKKIATVSSKGIVTAKKEGTTKITVTSKKNKKKKTSITVVVTNSDAGTGADIPAENSQTPSATATITTTPDSTPSTGSNASAKPTETPFQTPTGEPTDGPVPTPPEVTDAPTQVPDASSLPTNPTNTETASGTATPDAPGTTSPAASPVTTVSPTPSSVATPTVQPTTSPTGTPATSPTLTPTATPTASPTASPTLTPTATPSPTPIGTTLVNSSFETGTDGWTDRHCTVSTVTGGCTEDGEDDPDGKALKATRSANWQGPYFDLTNQLECGATYTFSCYVKLDENASNNTTLVLTTSFNGNNSFRFEDLTKWNKVTFTFSSPDDMTDTSYNMYFETWNDSTPFSSIYVDNATLTITDRNEANYDLPSLSETYKDLFPYFGVGAGKDSFLGTNGMAFIKSQFNSYTAGNAMKPDAIMKSGSTINESDPEAAGYYIPDNYGNYTENTSDGSNVVYPKLDFSTTDALLKQAHDNGIKVRFHVLIWHQQTPAYFFKENYNASGDTVNQEVMNTRIEFYVKTVMNHVLKSEYADVIYTFDVVNEYFHSHNAAANDNTYWEAIYNKDFEGNDIYRSNAMSTKPTYVKLAFKYAHDILVEKNRTDISLIYNDYNTYDSSITGKIVEMINWLNTADTINTDGAKICQGVGMQSHLDVSNSFHSVSAFQTALTKFKVAGIEIQITELDATNYIDEETGTKKSEEEFAAYYKDIMNAIITTKKDGANINSVTLWSLYDNVSWRASGTPCVFSGLYNPKDAFWALIDAATES